VAAQRYDDSDGGIFTRTSTISLDVFVTCLCRPRGMSADRASPDSRLDAPVPRFLVLGDLQISFIESNHICTSGEKSGMINLRRLQRRRIEEHIDAICGARER